MSKHTLSYNKIPFFSTKTRIMLSQRRTQYFKHTVKYASTFFGECLANYKLSSILCNKAIKRWEQSKYEIADILNSFLFLLWRLLVHWFKRLISPITLTWLSILVKCYIVLETGKQPNVLILSFNPTYFRMHSDPVTLVSGNKLTY